MPKSLDRDRLLAAFAELPQGRQEALEMLPHVLGQQGEGHATVTAVDPDGGLRLVGSNVPALPPGLAIPPDGVVGRTARQQRPTYLTRAREHPDYRAVAGLGYPVELALPILERDHVVAVLNLERARPFAPAERRTLEVFATAVGHYLTQASRSREARITAALSAQLAEAPSFEAATRGALEIIAPEVGAYAVAILREAGGSMRVVAATGAGMAGAAGGTPYPQGLVWSACLAGEARFTRDYGRDPRALASLSGLLGPVVLALPIDQHHTQRAALCLQYRPDTHVSAADIELLTSVGRHLALIFANLHTTALQDHLLELHARALGSETTDIYQHVLDAATAHVPGAEAGSLIVRRDDTEAFRYVAVNGFDFDDVKDVLYTEADMRLWYAGNDAEWNGGRARILSSESLDLAAFSYAAGSAEEPVTPAEMQVLKSTVCLPVTYRGEVLAVVNLDNFTREDAFGRDSLRTLTLFGPPVAALLASARHRDATLRASRTDPLTGLTNRDGFKLRFEQQHALSSRSGAPYTLLVMDLTGFKRINDTHGHAAGDEALMRVARTLGAASRAGDVIARWGGDEFVALLPATAPADAAPVIDRFERAIAGIIHLGQALGVDIGAASYPADAVVGADLLRVADTRMYERKRRARAEAALAEPR